MNSDNKQRLADGDILVVDDDTANLKFLMDFLSESGYRVRAASDGELALRSVQARLPDLILLDYKMPGMDGVEVCRQLKTNSDTRDIPVIFLSGLEETGSKVKAFEAGAIDYITKPIESAELLGRIENQLKLYRLQQRLALQSEQLLKEIEERKRAENHLRIERDKLKNIFEAMVDGVYIANEHYDISYVNPVLVKDFGEYEGRKCYEYFHGRTEPCSWCKNSEVLAGKTVRWEWTSIKNGKTYDLIDTPIINADSSLSKLEIFRDITEQRKMEEQLFLNEKLATIAGLAAGVAHEINTPLTAILQAHQLVAMGLSQEDGHSKEKAAECNVDLEAVRNYFKKNDLDFFMDGIRDSALKAGTIINNLLEFSRPHEGSFSSVNLKDIMESSLLLSQADYDMKKKYNFMNVRVVKEYDPDPPTFVCVATEIEQVILNLIKNSVQAMAGEDLPEKPCIILRTAITDNRAVIEVEDNGPGIPEKVIKYIFDPFFTTKDVGKGTGLGLSVSHAIIVDKHKGEIHVESKPGQGTKFIVKLPMDQETKPANPV
jgi:signal transduction histidine kinase/FixJ family two-component response regulator